MQSGAEGAQQAAEELGAEITTVEGIEPEQASLEDALRELAEQDPDLVVAHGGQNTDAAKAVAPEYPEVQFVVTQSGVTGPNLSSYEVLQEQSAWLAGAAAGLLTETDVVGHMSGIRPIPGLKGRAAYVDGVRHTNPDARVLTNFSGNQDDTDLAYRIAMAEIEEGADYIFTMLNAGRPGVTRAMEETGKARQFGNVRDYTQDGPIFVGSAVADSGQAVHLAIDEFSKNTFTPGEHTAIGLENPDAVRLTLAEDVPAALRQRVEGLSQDIIEGRITVKTEYDGPEFTPE